MSQKRQFSSENEIVFSHSLPSSKTENDNVCSRSSDRKCEEILFGGDNKTPGTSSQITSSLDRICKPGILDESSDFIQYKSKNKPKTNPISVIKKTDPFLCEICKEDIAELNLYDRGVHLNNCIDKQTSTSSAPVSSLTQPLENEVIFILECPLCFKSFLSPEARSHHIKKCGKSKGLGTHSVIKALELQERHALEREALGLPINPCRSLKLQKSSNKRAIVEPKSKTQSDLQLAKALSLSLTTSCPGDHAGSNEDAFSRTILRAPTVEHHPGRKPPKHRKGLVTSLLVLRSDEDRKMLLQEKITSIIAPVIEDVEMDEPTSPGKNTVQEVSSALWNLSSKSGQTSDYYLEHLLDWIKPSDIAVGTKLRHLSQIPGHEIVTQHPINFTFSSQNNNEKCPSVSGSPGNPRQDVSSSILGCLRTLVASPWMSDVDIHTACGSVIPAHKLLLTLRCPPLKRDLDFCSNSKRATLVWKSVSFDVALQFLNFVYSGIIHSSEEISPDLLNLATKYEVSDLEEYLTTQRSSMCISKSEENKFPESRTEPAEDFRSDELNMPNSSASQSSSNDSNLYLNSQNYNNVNLDIVYNCINSSLRPTQYSTHESSSLCAEPCDNLVECPSSPELAHYNDYKILTNPGNEKQNYFQENHLPLSPEIFDVNDSDDNCSYCENSEPFASQRSNIEEPCFKTSEMHLTAEKSNSSEDSVKILKSFPSHYMYKDCDESKITQSPKCPTDAIFTNSPFKESYSKSNKSKLLEIFTPKMDYLNVVSDTPTKEPLIACFSPKSSESLCSKVLVPCQVNDEADKTLYNNMKTHVDDEIIKISDDSVDSAPHNSNNNNLIKSVNTVSDDRIMCSSLLKTDNSKIKMDFILEDSCNSSDDDSFLLPLSQRLCPKQSNDFICDSVDSIYRKNSPSKSRDKSPDIQFDWSKMESLSFSKAASTSISQSASATGSFEEMKKVAVKPEVIDFANDEEQPSFEGSLLLPKEHSSLMEGDLCKTVPFFNECGKKDRTSVTDSPNLSKLSFHSLSDFMLDENPADMLPEDNRVDSHSKNVFNNDTKSYLVTGTPKNKPIFMLSDSPITPLPDYKSMMTPDIKLALKKYGLKAVPRKKAVTLLHHIYDETHPLLDGEIPPSSLPTSSKVTSKKDKVVKPRKRKMVEDSTKPVKKAASIEVVHPIYTKITSDSEESNSESSEAKQLGYIPEFSFSQCTQDSPTKNSADDLMRIKKYILMDNQLYNNILTYTPLNLVEFHSELKGNGIKISIQKLMDFLDEQCITFTCPRKEEYKKKQTTRSNNFRKRMIAKMSQQDS